jgi:hypothetical protein
LQPPVQIRGSKRQTANANISVSRSPTRQCDQGWHTEAFGRVCSSPRGRVAKFGKELWSLKHVAEEISKFLVNKKKLELQCNSVHNLKHVIFCKTLLRSLWSLMGSCRLLVLPDTHNGSHVRRSTSLEQVLAQ